MTRLAIWSAGDHARRNLLPAIGLSQHVTLAGIFSRNPAVLTQLAADYGCRTWTDSAVMLADPDVDAVLIAGPNGVHFEQARAALSAGKHVWCEKSLTPVLAETQALVALAGYRGLVLAEAFMFVHHPQFAAIRSLLDSGELGRISSIQTRFGFPHLAPDNIRYSSELAGGALLDVGAYCVSAALHLMGKRPSSVAGAILRQPGYAVDTDGASMLVFEGGGIALGDWGFGRTYRNEIEIWGDKGMALIRRAFSKPPSLDTGIEIALQQDNARRTIAVPGGTNQFAVMMDCFARAADDTALCQRLAEDALRQAEVIEALRQTS